MYVPVCDCFSLNTVSKHHNRQRLVLGPDSLLNVNNITQNIFDGYTKPTVQ